MSVTSKRLSRADHEQVLQGARVDEDLSILTNGFLAGKVGRKVVQTIITTNVPNDSAQLAFSENGVALYTYLLIFTDATQAVLMSAERTA